MQIEYSTVVKTTRCCKTLEEKKLCYKPICVDIVCIFLFKLFKGNELTETNFKIAIAGALSSGYLAPK